MFKIPNIKNIKIRHSAVALIAAAVVVGTAAFILAHTHQSLKVQPVVPPSSIVSNGISSENVISSSSKTPSKISTKTESRIASGKIIKEPGEVYKPKNQPQINLYPKLKSKYGLLFIPTYDGSNQLTHPKVLYFANGWNGYHYWMSMTPYPYAKDEYENPSIVVSNDGTNWSVPAGLKNPVSGLPSDVKYGGYYSDPHLVMNGNVMELWYRYNPGDTRTGHAHNNINMYYKKVSTDGIHWSGAQFLGNFGSAGHMSMAILCEDGVYRSWYADYDKHLYYSQSTDSQNWSRPVVASVPLPVGYKPYHQDIIKIGSRYCLLQCAIKPSNYTFAQFFASSMDGIHFSNVKRIYPSGDTALWNNISIYRSTMFEKDGKLEMYLTLWFQKLNASWYITHRSFPLSDFLPSEPSTSSAPSKSSPPSSTPSPSPSPTPTPSPTPSGPAKPSSGSSALPASGAANPASGIVPVKRLLPIK
ncbi:MAG TPA: hypothetical protein VHO94_02050 [Oscillospiraceae bacterium]|nr:hypothetical protein [Oscillospiraceae bacterium]